MTVAGAEKTGARFLERGTMVHPAPRAAFSTAGMSTKRYNVRSLSETDLKRHVKCIFETAS
jgi:hypothetical protein